tara:strand:+ start:5069 stop:5305 length:237 start_codon:yes stop_codon:yes gene_type:complete
MVSSVMAKVYQVEKAKKVERRKVKEGIVTEPVAEPVVEKVVEPVVEKVVESGEVKAKPAPEPKKPIAKKKGQTKKKES